MLCVYDASLRAVNSQTNRFHENIHSRQNKKFYEFLYIDHCGFHLRCAVGEEMTRPGLVSAGVLGVYCINSADVLSISFTH